MELKQLFNTGQRFRELELKDKLPLMSEEEQLELMASDGKLIKRPLIVDGDRVVLGYKEDEYREVWGN